jgi:5-methylthioadenosine/S-adenosylhomocysteine deaminase
MGKILLRNVELKGIASDILIDGEYISEILPAGSISVEDAEVVDCTGKAAVPGFVNMHTHAGMMMMKGVGEDIAFHEWIDKIWQIKEKLDDELVYQSTRLACL